MQFVNMTGKDLVVNCTHNGLSIPFIGESPKLVETVEGTIWNLPGTNKRFVPVVMKTRTVEGLPAPKDGVTYLVKREVAQLVRRRDVFGVELPENGKVNILFSYADGETEIQF